VNPPARAPVARQWRARATPDGARAYEAHFRSAVLADLAAVDGWLGAQLLVREDGDEMELVTLVWFESLDAVRRFAGADPERAVVAPEARRVLSSFDDRVTHYRVAAGPAQPS
jgi:heme-degrading monooxygenase HmoA